MLNLAARPIRVRMPLTSVYFLLLFLISFPTLSAQEDHESAISDRLYAFERSRINHDSDQLLNYVYPELFTLIPREVLREKMNQHLPANHSTARIHGFKIAYMSEPLQSGGKLFVRVRVEYNYSQSSQAADSQQGGNGKVVTPERQRVSRELLAVRTDRDLEWYFLEVENGQAAMLSAIIPAAALQLR